VDADTAAIMGRIAVLAAEVQGQIAAGEVVERPASIVKELVENAVDAGARHVEVVLEEGGLGRITVRDDGCGMTADEAHLAFARHATSKLRRAEDLLRVPTFGFRGEALPSIAAAARVRLTTRRAEDASASVVEACGEHVHGQAPAGAAPGTTVEVTDLFATTPARRKFLRRPATELGHVSEAVVRAAVASPGIGFRLRHERREVLSAPPVADLHQRLVQVLGAARSASFVTVDHEAGRLRVGGVAGSPRDSLSSARHVWTYVAIEEAGAARWIRDRLLLRAVLDGYASLLMRGRYPLAVLFLTLPAGSVDVNVHPAKLEVRFRDPQAVHHAIGEALRRTLTASLKGTCVVGGAGPAAWAAEALGGGDDRGDGVGVAAPPDATPAVASSPPSPAPRPQPGLWSAAPGGFRGLRFMSQLFRGYLLCDGGDRLVLIDQHAAHERVLFERLREQCAAGAVPSDALLVAETIRLSPLEVTVLGERAALLGSLGIDGEPFGDDTYLLRGVPRLLVGRDVAGIVRAVAAELLEEGAAAAAARALDLVQATVACHAATRVGQRLDASEVSALLAAMDGVAINAHCPHGRPVAVQLARGQVEALFGR
jgi:DNA mismatch repair protein MutL